jgi:hypothetical protein
MHKDNTPYSQWWKSGKKLAFKKLSIFLDIFWCHWKAEPEFANFGSEPVFLNFIGAQESILQAYVTWRAGTTALFLLGSYSPYRCSKIPVQSLKLL